MTSHCKLPRLAVLAVLVLFHRHSAVALAISPPAGAIPPLDELAGDWQNVAEVRFLPAINNLRGSAHVLRDALAVGKLSFPPVTMTGDTGALLIDDRPPALEQTRWFTGRSNPSQPGLREAMRTAIL